MHPNVNLTKFKKQLFKTFIHAFIKFDMIKCIPISITINVYECTIHFNNKCNDKFLDLQFL